MFRKVVLATTAALGLGALCFGASGASAAAISPGSPLPVLEGAQLGHVEQVATKKQIRRWRYNQRRHGNRFRARRGGFNYYYGGYYYARPWWTYDNDPGFSISIGVPGIAVGVPGFYASGGGGWDAHVRWCLNHYRTYNPRNNTYAGFDGYRRRCRSPFG